jgi:CBS domain containing-hemolysin-like protein
MFFTVIIALLIVSQFISYLNGAVSELSQDIFNRLIQLSPNKPKLQKIWDKYDEICHSLLFIQSTVILFAAFFTGLNSIFFIFERESQTINVFSNVPLTYSSILILLLISFIILFLVIIATNLLFYYLGKRFCEKTISTFASFIYFITFLLIPIITQAKFILIRISGRENDDVRMEELTDLVEEARKDGSIDAEEYRLLKNVMNFNDVLVSDVMTPRVVLFSCKANMTVGETAKLPELQMFSRFPIWNGESIDDEIIGYVLTKEIFNAALNGFSDKELTELARPVEFIPENAELGKTLETFILQKQHLFLVVDEYGGIEGLITMEDVFETVLGVEIVDEADKVVDLRLLAKSRRELRLKENYNFDNN